MSKHTQWLWIALAATAVGAGLIARHPPRRPAPTGGDCQALAAQLQAKQASKERDKIRVYYEFKSTEMADEEAWRKAVHEVESQITMLSNAVARCQARP